MKSGFQVFIEEHAGRKAHFKDADYIAAGATIKAAQEVFGAGMFFNAIYTIKLLIIIFIGL